MSEQQPQQELAAAGEMVHAITEKIKRYLKKYFWEGQKLEEKAVIHIPPDATLNERILLKYRKPIGFLVPFCFFQLAWWPLAIKWDFFAIFPRRYLMSITMIFGSMIAGMTSEGGGAVAFPVMTLALKVHPSIARDFSLMIQSCGMSAAAFSILFMKLRLEWHSLIFCTIGGVVGLITGLHFVAPALPPPTTKMVFVSISFAFAIALFILNYKKKRRTFDSIVNFNWWRALVLMVSGFLGGQYTAMSGSGVDICSFSVLTLLFHVTEKVATPTSIVLMAVNTCVGFYWRHLIMDEISVDAWEFLAVCVPIVVIGAPLGSLIASHFHRQVLASMIYILETIGLISGFVIVKPNVALSCASVAIVIGGAIIFFVMSRIGMRLMPPDDETEPVAEGEGDKERQNKSSSILSKLKWRKRAPSSDPKRIESAGSVVFSIDDI